MTANTLKKTAALLLCIGMILMWGVPAVSAGDVPRMTKEELKKRMGNAEVIILDVRTGGDWNATPFKIQGAVRVNPRQFSTWAENFPKDKTLVLYCA